MTHAPELTDSELNELVDRYVHDRGALIGLLQDIQSRYRYLPRPVLEHVAERLDVPLSQLYALATFYRAFSLEPRGRHQVCVCMGTSCHVKGGSRLLDRLKRDLECEVGGMSPDGKFSLAEVRCVGACSIAPIVVVDEDVHGYVSQGEMKKILNAYD